MANDKYNIGLLTSHLEDDYANAVCKGCEIGAKEADVNLFIFAGRYLEAEYFDKERAQYEYQYNTLFSYPNKDNMDALLIMLGTIGCAMNYESRLQFLKQYEGIPIVLIGSEMEGYSNIIFDNRTGLREEVEHMIVKHGATRIGFVSGPVTNGDAMERLQVYKDVLMEHHLPVLEERIVYGNFSEYSQEVVADLLDRNPDLQAIVFANDQMAIGGYTVMKERGIRIGADILVGGFDDADCCLKLIPNLTTVKADAVELGYQAVLDALQCIENPQQQIHSTVASTLLCRKSCGCQGFEFQDIAQYTDIDIEKADTAEQIAEVLNSYFFYSYNQSEAIGDCRKAVQEFVQNVMHAYDSKDLDGYSIGALVNQFAELVDSEKSSLGKFISTDVIFNGLDVLSQKLFYLYPEEEQQFLVCQLMNAIYKRMIEINTTQLRQKEMDIEDLNHLINRIAQDMLTFEHDDDAAYGVVIDKMVQLHMDSSYLYTYEKPITHYAGDHWEVPDSVELKAYHNREQVCEVPEEQQRIPFKDFFQNSYLPSDRRYTMVVSPMACALEHYGIWLCEVEHQYFNFISSINNQLFSAVKIIHLLQEKEATKLQLEQSLQQIKENNLILDEVSKSDELTGIYNRRGFLAMVKAMLLRKENQGQKAIAMYIDMDNLKIVNDRFGHEEGDFSLRFIADVLKESMRQQDIVARMGGDEFAVFAIVGEWKNAEEEIRNRIQTLTREKNALSGKDYLVNMSIGFCDFVCHQGVDISEVLDEADKNLYFEKQHKKKQLFKNEVSE